MTRMRFQRARRHPWVAAQVIAVAGTAFPSLLATTRR